MSEIKGVREIMYIGPKERKVDNVNEKPARVWDGVGSVQRVTALEANKLLTHPTIWEDVTEWPDKKRIARVRQIQETLRESQRRMVSEKALRDAELLSDEELLAIVERRKKPIKLPKGQAVGTGRERAGDEPTDDEGNIASRPTKTTEVVDQIVGVILEMDEGKAELFDENGHATLEAVTELLGYEISDIELKAALRQLHPEA